MSTTKITLTSLALGRCFRQCDCGARIGGGLVQGKMLRRRPQRHERLCGRSRHHLRQRLGVGAQRHLHVDCHPAGSRIARADQASVLTRRTRSLLGRRTALRPDNDFS